MDSGLWLDEIITYVDYATLPFQQILTTYESENQHFLYSLLAHASFLVFGESSWSLRLPAVVFGVGSIWALYLLGRQVSTAREGLLSAALLAFSYHHVWFSQNARGYTGLLFWALLSSWLFLRGLAQGPWWLWVLYGLAAALGLYTHMTMVFVLLAHLVLTGRAIMLASRDRPARPGGKTGAFIGFACAGFLTVLLYAPVLPQIFGTINTEGAGAVAAWQSPVWTLLETLRGLQIGFAGGAAVVLILLFVTVGLVSYARSRMEVIILLAVPSVVGAGTVVAMGHHLWPRFFFFVAGFAALVLIRGVKRLADRFALVLAHAASPGGRALLGTTLCLGLIGLSAVSALRAFGPKQDYRAALDFVQAARQPGDAVVAVGLAIMPYAKYYKTDWETPETLRELNVIRDRAVRTWLVYTLEPQLRDTAPDIFASILHDFHVIRQFDGTLAGGTVVVTRSDAPPVGKGAIP